MRFSPLSSHCGAYPSEKFINKLAKELDADADELLLPADKVPSLIRKRIRERPEVFRAISKLNDRSLEQLTQQVRKLH